MARTNRSEASANLSLVPMEPTPYRAPKAPAPKGWSLPVTKVLKIVGVLVAGALAYPYVMGV